MKKDPKPNGVVDGARIERVIRALHEDETISGDTVFEFVRGYLNTIWASQRRAEDIALACARALGLQSFGSKKTRTGWRILLPGSQKIWRGLDPSR